MQRTSDQPTDRRRFLKTSAAASAAAAASVLIPGGAAADMTETAEPTRSAEGYRETRHVSDYYRSARL